MLRRLSAALAVLAAPFTAHAERPMPDLIPRKTLFGNPDRAAPNISPDGKRLAYLAPVDGVLNVWVGPAADPDQAKPVTADKKRGIRQYFWAYTNDHILYLQDVGGDEDYHLFAVDLASGKTTELTPGKKIRAEVQQVSPKFPTEVLVGLNDRDPRFHDIYRVDLTSGTKKLVRKNDGYAGFVTDDDYNVRFAQKLDADGSSVLFKAAGDGFEEYLRIPMEDTLTTGLGEFDGSGKSAYMVDSRGRDTAALYRMDLETREKTLLADDPRADAGTPLLHPTTKELQAVTFTYARRERKFFDPAVEKDFAVLAGVSGGEVGLADRTLDDSKWVVAFLGDAGPVKYYLYDRATKQAKFLFTNQKALEGLPLQPMHSAVVKSRDGLNLVCYLTLPPGSDTDGDARPDAPVPTVLFVHGGPWARDNWGYNPYHQLMANRGYAVLSVNFRGSTGFGKNFLNAANKEWAGKMHEDLLDAVEWAKAEKIADPAKVAVMGGSYGGYATLVGLTFTPDVFACGVDIVGPSSLVTLLQTIPPYWGPMMQMFKDRVGDVASEAGRDFLLDRSPLTYVERIKKPLLIGQGANDPRVKQAESDQIVKEMQSKGIPVTYVLFPDEGHGFARPENNIAFVAVAEAFLARHLGGRYEPIGEAFEGSSIKVPAGAEGLPGLAEKLPAGGADKE